MPGDSGVTYNTCAFYHYPLHTWLLGASGARRSLLPRVSGGAKVRHASGAQRRENADVCAFSRSKCEPGIALRPQHKKLTSLDRWDTMAENDRLESPSASGLDPGASYSDPENLSYRGRGSVLSD